MLNKKYKLDQYNLFSTVAIPPLASDHDLWKNFIENRSNSAWVYIIFSVNPKVIAWHLLNSTSAWKDKILDYTQSVGSLLIKELKF